MLGERESGTTRLDEAVAAYDSAISVFVTAGIDRYADRSGANRDRLIALLDQGRH
jgi:hypothetical protein